MFNDTDINKMVEKQLKSDEINNYVEEKVKSVLKKTIDDEFSSYGSNNDNGAYQTIRESMKSAISLNMEKLNLAEFQSMYIDTIKNSLNQIVTKDLHGLMHENMKSLLITDKPILTLNEFIFDFMESNDKTNEYRESLNEFSDEYFDNIHADDIDIDSFTDSDEIIGLFLEKSSNGRGYIEVCFDTKENHEYSFSYEFAFRLRKIDKEDNLYECWSFAAKGIDREDINIVTTKFEDFEKTAYQLVKGISKIRITEDELKNHFHFKD